LTASSTDRKKFKNFSKSAFSLLWDGESSKLDHVDSSDNSLFMISKELSL
jgi:hypothetical protein